MAAAAGACISFLNSPVDLPYLGVQLGTSKTASKVHIIIVNEKVLFISTFKLVNTKFLSSNFQIILCTFNGVT